MSLRWLVGGLSAQQANADERLAGEIRIEVAILEGLTVFVGSLDGRNGSAVTYSISRGDVSMGETSRTEAGQKVAEPHAILVVWIVIA